MTELELYRFITTEGLEIGWRGTELVLWIDFLYVTEFAGMIKSFLSDCGVDVNLQAYCISLDIVPICEWYDIDPENICKKEATP